MNRINQLFEQKSRGILSIYFCAGSPKTDNTVEVIRTLEAQGVDLIEIGIPFSDPMADGPVIQDAATQALRGGMTLRRLLEQLKDVRSEVRRAHHPRPAFQGLHRRIPPHSRAVRRAYHHAHHP